MDNKSAVEQARTDLQRKREESRQFQELIFDAADGDPDNLSVRLIPKLVKGDRVTFLALADALEGRQWTGEELAELIRYMGEYHRVDWEGEIEAAEDLAYNRGWNDCQKQAVKAAKSLGE